jgi:hypothetical protein
LDFIASELRYAKHIFGRRGWAAVSLCLTGLLWLQLAMAASEPLHKFFHADADDPGHECAVTLFVHGQVDASPVDVPFIVPVTRLETTPPAIFSIFSATIKDLPPGRAPPVLSAAS